MKSTIAIRRELARVKRELTKADNNHVDRDALYGSMQALEWLLDPSMAMAPSKAFKVKP